MHALRLALLLCGLYSLPASSPLALADTTLDGATPATLAPSWAVPPQLLASVDAIMQAGGYRQAATAYAQLNVRYGSSDEIFSRRFIAQIACHDWDQAAVVLASAQVAGYHIHRLHLPAETLATLLPGNAQEVGRLTENLAAYALSAADQVEALNLMGVWLGLSGDDTRAALFLAMAEKLSQEIPASQPIAEPIKPEELPAPRSKAALISLE